MMALSITYLRIFLFDRHITHSEASISYQQDDNKLQRKLFFKKRSTSSTCAVSWIIFTVFFIIDSFLIFSMQFYSKAYWRQRAKRIKYARIKVLFRILRDAQFPIIQHLRRNRVSEHFSQR